MPTVCRLLRRHKQVSGIISGDTIRAINAAGGWAPEEGLREWVQPEYAGQRHALEESSFTKSESAASPPSNALRTRLSEARTLGLAVALAAGAQTC